MNPDLQNLTTTSKVAAAGVGALSGFVNGLYLGALVGLGALIIDIRQGQRRSRSRS